MDRSIIINGILIPSLQRLYKMDYDNIRFGVSERNICARLAHHMENIMREYDCLHNEHIFVNFYADVEYNRMGNGELKQFENSELRPQYMVSDLLIQSRGGVPNLLAVEMKRKTNYKGVKTDKERLMSIISKSNPYVINNCVRDTQVGAFVRFSPKDVKVEIFENVNGNSMKTQEFLFQYLCRGNDLNDSQLRLYSMRYI